MAGELIGALRVALGFDTAEFTAGTKKARAEAKSTAASIQSSLSTLNNAITVAFTGAIATAVFAAGRAALDYASSLDEVSQQLGVTAKDLQVYRYAATQVGISQEDMDKGLSKLTLSIGQAAEGSKKQATAFNDLGINVRTANGDIRTAGDILPQLANALAQIKDPATRAAIEVELFGKTGQKLDTLLAGGSDAIDNMRRAAEDLGIVLSEDQIQNADKTADKLSELKLVLEANIASAVANNASSIYDLISALEALVLWAGKAATAWKVFILNERATAAEGNARGWFISNEQKLQYLQQAADLRDQANDILNPKVVARRGRAAGDMFDFKGDVTDVKDFLASLPRGGANAIAGGGGSRKVSGGSDSGARRAAADALRQEIEDIKADAAAGVSDEVKHAGPIVGLAQGSFNWTDLVDQGRKATDEYWKHFHDAAEDRVRSVADLFENAMEGGAGSFWASFKHMGFEVVAQIAARLLTNNGGQGGNFGDILGASSRSVFGKLLGIGSSLFGGLGGTGGSGVTFNDYGHTGLPHLAGGGTIGGLSGIDKNLLSINGMPVARVGRGEMLRVEPDNGNRRGGGIATIVPSPYFDVVVDRRAVGVAAPMASQAAVAGSSGAQVAILRQRSRSIP